MKDKKIVITVDKEIKLIDILKEKLSDASIKTLKQYFNISLNNENQSLPYFITYNSFNDSYLISNIETFGNYQTDFHYQIIKQKKFMNKNIITVKSTSQNEENIYEVQFICNKSCYFVSSKIIK